MTSTRYVGDDELVPESYLAAWQALRGAGIEVIALRMNPTFVTELPDGSTSLLDVSACVELHGENAPECRRVRDDVIASPSPIELIDSPPANVHFVDLTDYFCPNGVCPPVIGNVMIYRQGSHITETYARSLAGVLEERIEGLAALARNR